MAKLKFTYRTVEELYALHEKIYGSRLLPKRWQIRNGPDFMWFLTHGSSEGRKVSHCYRSRCCYGEPTCIARLVQFEVVSIQPRPHHIQHLNEVTVGRGCSVVTCRSVCFYFNRTCAFLQL